MFKRICPRGGHSEEAVIAPLFKRDRYGLSYALVHYTVVFLHTDYHIALSVVAVGSVARANTALSGIEHTDVKEAVLAAVPSPVDVVETITIGSIAHKLVSTRRRLSSIEHRTLCYHLAI